MIKKLLFIAMLGAMLDIRGNMVKNILKASKSTSKSRPQTVQEAFSRDIQAIGNDMRNAMNKYGEVHSD